MKEKFFFYALIAAFRADQQGFLQMSVPPMPYSGTVEIEVVDGDYSSLQCRITEEISEQCKEYGGGYHPVSVSVTKL